MPASIRKLTAAALAPLPTLLILGLLAALAVWGARNDWKLPPLPALWGSEAPEKTDPASTVKVDTTSAGPAHIEFPSVEAWQKTGLKLQPARVETLARYVTANGTVDYDPPHYARLTARTAGTIRRVYKEIGEPIRKGEVLLLLDAAEVGKAKADFLTSLAQVKLRSTTLERLQAVDRQGGVPERSVRDAEAALREARIRLFNDQQALLNLGLPVRLADVDKLPDDELARRLRLLGLPEAVTKELDPETLTANLLPLTAPFDGVVVDRNVAVGEVEQLTSPKTLFIVADVRQLHVDLDVNPEDMAEIRLGQPVIFRPDGSTFEAAARVSHISPEVDEKTRRVRVHAEMPNLGALPAGASSVGLLGSPSGQGALLAGSVLFPGRLGLLRPNAFGTGRIRVGERPGAVLVPAEAVQADGSANLVFVKVSDTGFEARKVKPGLRQGDEVEVSDVRPGEEVVTAESFVLKSELQKGRIGGGDE
jgi:cobalt-zinc-cadmium efflux system membrane fusion protein